MAPDLNSLPPSLRHERPSHSHQASQDSSQTPSRRASQQMPPPPPPPPASSVPSSTLGYSTSNRNSFVTSSGQIDVPLRHPRPLTAAEIYLECEKEQEAVVNRLTRELSALRAQAASVASNASQSSTSTSMSLLPVDAADSHSTQQMTNGAHPTPYRRHRSSSSLSTRSTSQTMPSATWSGQPSSSSHNQTGSVTSIPPTVVSQASVERAAAAASNPSRRTSVSASGNSTPARQSMDISRHGPSSTLPHRPTLSRDPSFVSQVSANAQAGATHVPSMPSPVPSPTQNMPLPSAEVTAHRSELESLRAENEALRQRVRNLERALQTRRRDSSTSDSARPDPAIGRLSSPEARHPHNSVGVAAWAAGDGGVGGVAGPRERSESQSTTASSRRGLPVEDDIRFGESAGSGGAGRVA